MAPQRIPGVPYASPPVAESSAKVLSWPPKLIVVHDTGNPTSTKEGEARYAATRPLSGATSAHAYIDNGGVLGSLRLDRQAWAAYAYANANGLHLEMCLTGDRPTTWRITAGLVGQLCDMAGIPKVKLTPADVAAGKRGVCGHRDITIGLGVGDHTDPGADFPWTQFMGWVNAPTNGGLSVGASEIIAAFANGDPTARTGESVEPVKWRIADEKWQREVSAALAADKVRDEALAAAVKALAVGSGMDPAALLAEIDRVVDEAVKPLREQLAALDAELDEARRRLAAALNGS